MRILGIDPGLQVCGYAGLDAGLQGENLVEAGVIRTDRQLPLEEKLHRIAQDMEALLNNLTPDVVAVEQLYAHYAHPRTAILMGHARGVILQCCAKRRIHVQSFSATKIKKATTGNGRAGKVQMQQAVQSLMSLPELPEPNDVADAIAVALCCANQLKLETRH
jgi:crossover junction endodeoxyribonuclease RuvC